MKSRQSFTLLELLVVACISSILLALLLTGIQSARVSAGRTLCAAKMGQLGLALHAHHEIHKAFPCQADVQVGSWMFRILPFVEQEALYRQGLDWRSSNWAKTWETVVPAFLCPSDGRVESGGVYRYDADMVAYSMTNYLGVAGSDSSLLEQGVWDGMLGCPTRATRIADVIDGLSNTLMVGERPPGPDLFWGWPFYRAFDNNMWVVVDKSVSVYLDEQGLNKPGAMPATDAACPDKSLYGPGTLTNFCDVLHFWSNHPGGGNWLFGDASVRFLNYDAKYLPAMATAAGGEVVEASP